MPYEYDFSEEARLTNDELARELAMRTALSADEIQTMLPRRIDKQRLAKLLEIVNGSTARHRKIATLRRNLNDLGGVLLKVLQKVI